MLGSPATNSAKFAFINVNSGTPVASISANNGNNASFLTGAGVLGTTNKQTLQLGSASTGNIDLFNFGTGIVHTNASGVLSSSAVNLASTDVTGILPVANGGSPFDQANGSIFERINTQDLLLGSNATSSAKFAFINVNSGTPTASISGANNNALYLTATGTLATTNDQALTLGDTNTGKIVLNSQGTQSLIADGSSLTSSGTFTANGLITANAGVTLPAGQFLTLQGLAQGSVLYANGSQQVIGTAGTDHQVLHGGTAPSFSAVDLTQDVSGILPAANGGSPFTEGNGAIFERLSTEDLLLGSNATASAKFGVLNIAGGTPTISLFNGSTSTLLSANGVLSTTGNAALTLGSAATGSIILSPTGSNTIGIGFNGTPLAALDLRSSLGTSPIASFSGKSSFAGLVVDNSGSGDIFTASASGATKFTINNSGAIQLTGGSGFLQTITSNATLSRILNIPDLSQTNVDFCFSSGNCAGAGSGITGTGTATQLAFFDANQHIVSDSNLYFDNVNKRLGLGTSTPVSTLDVRNTSGTAPTASFSGATTNAGLIVDQSGTGDIFTASTDGATKFVLYNNGNLGITGNTNVITTLTSHAITARTIALPDFSGTICLDTNNCGFATVGQNYWQLNNNLVSPSNDTFDFAIGGTATASAKFAFINTASGVPTASLSAGANNNTFLTADGRLGTTNAQTLTLGSSSTGNIVIDSGSNVTQLADNTIQLTGTAPIISSTNTLTINAFTLGGTLAAGGNSITNISSATFGTGNLTLAGNTISNGSNNNITITPNGSGNTILTSDFDSGVRIGSSANTPAPLSVSGGIGNNAAAIINQTNNGDILAASASGATKFAVNNNGNLQFAGGQTALSTITKAGVTPQTYTLPNASGTVCLEDAASCGFALGTNYWQSPNPGVIAPYNDTVDVLFGGTSSDSAKFAFLNDTSGIPTASLSAGSNNNTFLTADGNLGTTNGQTLTLGGASTGNIVLNSGSSLISLANDTTLAGNFTQTGATNFTTGTGLTTLGGNLTVNGSTLAITNAATLDLVNGNTSALNIEGGLLNFDTQNGGGRIGIGTTTPLEKLDVAGNATVSGNLTLSGAARNVQTTQNQTLTIGGNTTGQVVLSGRNNNPTGITLAGYGTGLIHANASGVLSSSLVNLTSATDVTGILPVANGGSPFTEGSGTIFERLTTQDLLLGSNATASAKFAFTNVNSGTPTASISGANNNATSLTATGNLGTTNAQSLTLGGASTGNIVLSNNTVLNNNFTQTGANTFTTGTGLTTVGGNLTVNGTILAITNAATLDLANGQTSALNIEGGLFNFDTQHSRIGIGTTTPTATLDVNGTASVSGELALYGTPQIQSTANQTLTIGGNTTGQIVLSGRNSNPTGITLAGYGTGLIHSDTNGVLSSSAIDLGSADVTGILPVINGGSPFEQGNGAITERITTQDLLLGSNS